MSNPVIQCEALGKSYLIGHQGARERYTALRDVIARQVRGVWQATRRAIRGQTGVTGDQIEEFWALRDVSFDVQEGEVIGIVGRNGAGKSTLLKILSRITEPTEGRVTLRGRVASLLEVGTGFHPELTGRENIYLNGAILGMSRAEIKRKFDEIVAFAEVEKFLDTPVKRFSSGMYVRLAFAVAAHLEPEILLVDEVLAVGDAQFQKKCLGKMQDVAAGGRTVLFVSHNMEAVERLTARSILLSNGHAVRNGPTREVVSDYLTSTTSESGALDRSRVSRIPDTVEVVDIWTENTIGDRVQAFRQGEPFRILFNLLAHSELKVDVAVVIENIAQQPLYTTHLSDVGQPIAVNGPTVLAAEIRTPMLRRGAYLVSVAVFSPDRAFFYDVIYHCRLFDVAGTADLAFPDDSRWGDLYVPITWTTAE